MKKVIHLLGAKYPLSVDYMTGGDKVNPSFEGLICHQKPTLHTKNYMIYPHKNKIYRLPTHGIDEQKK